MATSLDWSHHQIGPRHPCRTCGQPALMRDNHGEPRHKTCAEQTTSNPPVSPHNTGENSLFNTTPTYHPKQITKPDEKEKGRMALRAHHQALLRSATEYTGQGWPVFLLGRSKRPVANCPQCPKGGPSHDPEGCECLTCHGFYAATLNLDRIEEMLERIPQGLLAIRTGTASGLLVIDIDPAHGGRLDPAIMCPTHTVASGGGGWHLYYQHPGTPVRSRPMPDRGGVDIKADGGYVVAPPSIHPISHQPYRRVGNRSVNEMAPPLSALVKADPECLPVQPAAGPKPRSATHFGGEAISDPTALLEANLEAVRRAKAGKRRVTLYGAARGIARIVATGAITPDHAHTELVRVGREAQQTDQQIQAAITDGFRAEGVTP